MFDFEKLECKTCDGLLGDSVVIHITAIYEENNCFKCERCDANLITKILWKGMFQLFMKKRSYLSVINVMLSLIINRILIGIL